MTYDVIKQKYRFIYFLCFILGVSHIPSISAATLINQDGSSSSGTVSMSPLSETPSVIGHNGWPSGVTAGGIRGAVFDGECLWFAGAKFLRMNTTSKVMNTVDLPAGYTRTMFSYSSMSYDGKTNVIVVPSQHATIGKINIKTQVMTTVSPTWTPFLRSGGANTDEKAASGLFDGTYIWFVPAKLVFIVRYNPTTDEVTGYNSWPGGSFVLNEGSTAFAAGVFDGTSVWCLPKYATSIVKFNTDTGVMVAYDTWPGGVTFVNFKFSAGTFDGSRVWAVGGSCSHLLRIDVQTGVMSGFNQGYTYVSEAWYGAIFDGANIWLSPTSLTKLMRVNPNTGAIFTYDTWPAGVTVGP
eukprot:PhF_6_TR1962/c0_g1_i2/m.3201